MQLSVSPTNQVVLQKLSTNWWSSSFALDLRQQETWLVKLSSDLRYTVTKSHDEKGTLKNTAISNYTGV